MSKEKNEPLNHNSRYTIQKELGKGAIGQVYLVYDQKRKSQMALKTLHDPNSEDVFHLKSEFRALTDISHSNLVELYELTIDQEESFFTMEFVEGELLGDYIQTKGKDGQQSIDYQALKGALRQICEGIHHLHQAGKLHRDIKPGNIIIERGGRAVLLDFGLMTSLRSLAAVESDHSGISGTFAYMSPEQLWRQPLTFASDWYSVGIVLYECLTSQLPIIPMNELPPSPQQLVPETPPELNELTLALLQPVPENRPDGARLARFFQNESEGIEAAESGEEPIFIGRKEELSQLREALNDSRDNGSVIVGITGNSGMGKTALAHHFLELMKQEEQALIFNSRSHHWESLVFKGIDGIVDDLRNYLIAKPPSQIHNLTSEELLILFEVFPVLQAVPFQQKNLDESLPKIEPGELRDRAFATLRRILEALALDRPLVLWIDDFQWTDEDSVSLLLKLLDFSYNRKGTAGILLLLTSRSEEPEALFNFEELISGKWGTQSDFRQIALSHLIQEDAEKLAESFLQNWKQLEEVVDEVEKSPFFIKELSRFVNEKASGALEKTRLEIKPEEIMSLRYRELSPEEREIVEVASLSAGAIEYEHLLNTLERNENKWGIIQRLQKKSLLKHIGIKGHSGILPYHDRFREGVLRELTPTRQKNIHHTLAITLENEERRTFSALAFHFHGAGLEDKAGHYAQFAGDDAVKRLAFIQAAEFYQKSREWNPGTDQNQDTLLLKEADALVNAGHCGKAAILYRDSEKYATSTQDAWERRRKSAEQFMVSGRIQEGSQLMQTLFSELKVPYPSTPVRLIFSILTNLVRLKFATGKAIPKSSTGEASPELLEKIECCWATSKGLVLVDPMRGLFNSLLALLYSLQAGEVQSIGRGLAIFSFSLLTAGMMKNWATSMMRSAQTLAEETQIPYLLGFTTILSSQLKMSEGNWSGLVKGIEKGVDLLQKNCQGTTWECNIGSMGIIRGLEELGELIRYTEEVNELLRKSKEVGDVYAEATAYTYRMLCHIADNNPTACLEDAQRVRARFGGGNFNLQLFYILRSHVNLKIYQGECEEGWKLLQEAWPEIKKEGFLKSVLYRGEAFVLRSRLTLAIAQQNSADQDQYLSIAEKDAKALQETPQYNFIAHGILTQSGIQMLRNDKENARLLLKKSLDLFEEKEMSIMATCVKIRLAQLENQEIEENHIAHLKLQGIREPGQWFRWLTPGFP